MTDHKRDCDCFDCMKSAWHKLTDVDFSKLEAYRKRLDEKTKRFRDE